MQDQLLLSNSRQIHGAQDPAHTPDSTACCLCTTGQKGREISELWERWQNPSHWTPTAGVDKEENIVENILLFFLLSSHDTLCQSVLKSSFQRREQSSSLTPVMSAFQLFSLSFFTSTILHLCGNLHSCYRNGANGENLPAYPLPALGVMDMRRKYNRHLGKGAGFTVCAGEFCLCLFVEARQAWFVQLVQAKNTAVIYPSKQPDLFHVSHSLQKNLSKQDNW